MPADTLNEMILGFTVIIGTLVIYAVSLVIRFRKVTTPRKDKPKK